MDQIKLCPQCGAEMKYHPPGISKKTGKPYNAFYSCPSCGYTEWTDRKYQGGSQSQPKKVEKMFQEKQQRIQELHKDKKDNINWINALNNAVYLIAHHPAFARITDKVELAQEIKVWRRNFYNETIKGPEIVQPNDPDMDKVEDLASNGQF